MPCGCVFGRRARVYKLMETCGTRDDDVKETKIHRVQISSATCKYGRPLIPAFTLHAAATGRSAGRTIQVWGRRGDFKRAGQRGRWPEAPRPACAARAVQRAWLWETVTSFFKPTVATKAAVMTVPNSITPVTELAPAQSRMSKRWPSSCLPRHTGEALRPSGSSRARARSRCRGRAGLAMVRARYERG